MKILSRFLKKYSQISKLDISPAVNRSRISVEEKYAWHQFSDQGSLYRYLAQEIPVISAAVWVWERLCLTPNRYEFEGSQAQINAAGDAIRQLDGRLYTFEGNRKRGISNLLELFFHEIFTVGRFSFEVVPLPSGKGISHIRPLDTYRDIQWEYCRGKWIPFDISGKDKRLLGGRNFFYYGFGESINDPRGLAPMSCIPLVARIERQMLEDLALSSHNAGNPRLHIKIKPPEKLPSESKKDYVNRTERYFNETVSNFRHIEVDDNIFTWDTVEISLFGGKGSMPSMWKVNYEQVVENVVTGMKLYPWVVGRSHGTTKNWVEVQYNILMSQVESIQEEAVALALYLMQFEMDLRGIKAVPKYIFQKNQDPGIFEKRRAEKIHLETVDSKVKKGYITKDQGAMELGYSKAYKNDT